MPKVESVAMEKFDGIDKYKVEDACYAIQKAMEVQKDKKLFTAAVKMLKEKEKATQKAIHWADNIK